MKALKMTVFKQYKVDIEDLQVKMKSTQDRLKVAASKFDNMEDSIPSICRNMVNFYFDQRVEAKLDQFITMDKLKEVISTKMDYSYFRAYEKKMLEKEAMDDSKQVFNEKISKIERKLTGLDNRVTRLDGKLGKDALKSQMTMSSGETDRQVGNLAAQFKRLTERIENERDFAE